jgi:hypothetical protein
MGREVDRVQTPISLSFSDLPGSFSKLLTLSLCLRVVTDAGTI